MFNKKDITSVAAPAAVVSAIAVLVNCLITANGLITGSDLVATIGLFGMASGLATLAVIPTLEKLEKTKRLTNVINSLHGSSHDPRRFTGCPVSHPATANTATELAYANSPTEGLYVITKPLAILTLEELVGIVQSNRDWYYGTKQMEEQCAK